MSLDINIQKLSNHCKISLNGKCTIYNVGKLKEFLITAIETNENILIDLSLVNDFDTAGLQLFVSAKNMVNSKNNHVKKIKIKCQYFAIKAKVKYCVLTLIFGFSCSKTHNLKSSE